EEHRHALVDEPAGDDRIVLAEAVELETPSDRGLVLARARRIVRPRHEVADRLELQAGRVPQESLPLEPLGGDATSSLGARGDEVHLVPGRDEARERVGATGIALELGEERPVVEVHAELVLLLFGYL